jgi:hypothetical protein
MHTPAEDLQARLHPAFTLILVFSGRSPHKMTPFPVIRNLQHRRRHLTSFTAMRTSDLTLATCLLRNHTRQYAGNMTVSPKPSDYSLVHGIWSVDPLLNSFTGCGTGNKWNSLVFQLIVHITLRDVDCVHVGFDALQSCRWLPVFQGNVSPLRHVISRIFVLSNMLLDDVSFCQQWTRFHITLICATVYFLLCDYPRGSITSRSIKTICA